MRDESILGCIMKLLDISGKELALEIGTDVTTVSKWRTKKRNIAYSSEFSKRIAEYFLSNIFINQRQNLYHFLDQEISGFSEMAYEKQVEQLRQLLCEKGKYVVLDAGNRLDENEYHTSVQVFSTDETGWKLATETFWNDLKTRTEPEQVILCDFGDINWDTASEQISVMQINNIRSVAEMGHKVKIIDVIKSDYRSPKILFRWFPLYMVKGVELYYVIGNTPDTSHHCYYAADKGGILVGLCDQTDQNLNSYVFYEDVRLSAYYRKRAFDFYYNSIKMLHWMPIDDNLKMVRLLNENLSEAEITYMMNPCPTYINMSKELLCQVLRENHVSQERIETCIEVNRQRHAIRKHCRYIQIYDIDRLEELLLKDHNRMDLLSIVAGKDIMMTRAEFIHQLEDIVEVVKNNEMEIFLISFKEFGMENETVSLTVQENRLFIAWDDSRYSTMLYTKEPTFVGGMVMYVKDIIDKIHPLFKKPEWTINQLEKYISLYK